MATITIKERKGKKGTYLYLDIYEDGKHQQQSLKLMLIDNPMTKAEHQHNKEVKEKAQQMRDDEVIRRQKEKYRHNIKEVYIEEKQKYSQLERLHIKEFLSIKEACELTGVSRWTIHRMIKRGDLKVSRFGRRVIIKRTELNKIQ